MDALIAAAARALASGDVLGALGQVSLRDDPPALALRGIAMARLGELARARGLLRRAARAFGAQREPLGHARCVVAEAEVALALRDLGGSTRPLMAACAALAARGDTGNAMQARLIEARRLLLLGRLAPALAAFPAPPDAPPAPSPALAAVAALVEAEAALRGLQIARAQAALQRARDAAARAGISALQAEVMQVGAALERPAARLHAAGRPPLALRLHEVAALMASDAVVIDACRRGLRASGAWLPLARRPVLFALVHALARSWPDEAPRETLIETVFRQQRPDPTHRARLRVQMGRLRAVIRPWARIEATAGGFALRPNRDRRVVVLAPPIDGEAAALQALLSDGAGWSTSALALALDAGQRSVQRALSDLHAEGRVRSVGRGRAQRWLAPPLAGFTTILLLPATLPSA